MNAGERARGDETSPEAADGDETRQRGESLESRAGHNGAGVCLAAITRVGEDQLIFEKKIKIF